MHNFQYVPRSEYLPVKKELEKLINEVQDEVREHFTFSFTYVGSTHRKLITSELNGNTGYDFDVNIHVNDDEEEYSAEEIRTIIREAFNRHVRQYGYDYCEDSTRVLTIKRKDFFRSKIISSCDFAIVFDCDDGRQQYIHFNKNQRTYDWEYLPMSNSELETRAEWIRKNGHWNDVRELYLDKKKCNDNPDKRSRSLYTMPDLGTLVELADYYDVEIREIIDGERKSEGMEKEEKETLLKIADYVDKQKKQAIIRAAVLFSLEMLCCGFTIASAILVLNSKGQISAGYAVVPMFLTFVCSIALVINAKDYVGKIQRQQ